MTNFAFKYVIIDKDDVSSVNFSEVRETSASTLTWNIAEDQTFVKFDGETPDFLEGKTQYTHAQILTILKTEEWSAPRE